MRLASQVGGDEIGSLVGDPSSPGYEASVRLSAKGMEGFAEFRRDLRVCFHGGRWDILASDTVIPLPAVSKRISSINYSLLGVGIRTYVLLKSHDREEGREARVARRS